VSSRLGWAAATAAAVLILSAIVLLDSGFGESGVERVVRWTARSSLVLFCAGFAAPVLPAGAWLARSRSGLLAALASSHGLHAVAIAVLALLSGGRNLDERASPALIVGGLLAYAAIAWAALRPDHKLTGPGLLWVGVVFAVAYVPRALRSPVPFVVPVALLVTAMAARLLAWRRSRAATLAAAA
jgi:hypothetical protein